MKRWRKGMTVWGFYSESGDVWTGTFERRDGRFLLVNDGLGRVNRIHESICHKEQIP